MLSPAEQNIIDRSQHPQFSEHLDQPTQVAQGENLSCGDEVHFQLKIENNTIKTIRHQTKGCSVCAASADLLAEELEGKSLTEVMAFTPEQSLALLEIELSPARQKCALLPLKTLQSQLTDQP